MQVERAVEHISSKVDELALRPEVFGTRLDERLTVQTEHVMQLRAQQKELISAVKALSHTVTQLQPGREPSVGAGPNNGKHLRAASQTAAGYEPALWAALGAVGGALAAAAYVRAHR